MPLASILTIESASFFVILASCHLYSQNFQLGKEVGTAELDDADFSTLKKYVGDFASQFNSDTEKILKHKFTKLYPRWLRPYGRLYAY